MKNKDPQKFKSSGRRLPRGTWGEGFKNKNILIISSDAWGTNFVSKHHYATLLAQNGNRVFFLNPKTSQKLEGGVRITPVSSNLSVVDYNESFKGNSYGPSFLARWLQRLEVLKLSAAIGCALDVVWSFDPFRLQFLEDWQASWKIYHPVDFHDTAREWRAAKSADVILASSNLILRKFNPIDKPKALIHHGLAAHFLAPKIKRLALPGRFKVRVGYVGNLLYRYMDWSALFEIIEKHPRIGFYFIGPSDEASNLGGWKPFVENVKRLRALPNVFLIGAKPSAELPAYLKSMDLFLMAYTGRKDLERLANPHKILEFLSTGKAVVSHYIDQYSDKRDLICMAESNDGLPALFQKVVSDLPKYNSKTLAWKRMEFSAQNTYSRQLKRIEDILGGAPKRLEAPVSGKKIGVDVCVATYRRPGLLANLLESLARQALEGIVLRIIVVDNDPAEGARSVVEAFEKKNGFEVIYAVEPTQGISHARNRALKFVRGNYFAFVDDDETVAEDWLKKLLEAAAKYDAAAVFGSIESVPPLDAPEWVRRHYFFNRKKFKTGTVVRVGSTANVLVRREALKSLSQMFDPAFALTGGEDSDFFFRLYLAGQKMVRCQEALVYDHVAADRLTLAWILRRGYRAGQSYARVFVGHRSWPGKAAWALGCLALMLGGALALPWVWLGSRWAAVSLLTRVCYYAGKLSVLFGSGLYFQEYAAHRASVESSHA